MRTHICDLKYICNGNLYTTTTPCILVVTYRFWLLGIWQAFLNIALLHMLSYDIAASLLSYAVHAQQFRLEFLVLAAFCLCLQPQHDLLHFCYGTVECAGTAFEYPQPKSQLWVGSAQLQH